VIGYDPWADSAWAAANGVEIMDMDALLSKADILTIHVPGNEDGSAVNGTEEIAMMKNGAFLINISRGGIVDESALYDALKNNKLTGAAIDVFPEEPKANDDEFISPLRGLDNVILTPHIGGSTMEAQANIGIEVAEKLIKYSDNGTTISSVNFPEVALPGHPDAHRLLHVHANVPGVLSKINNIFSDRHINIASQYLQTNDKVGYVVVDINSPYDEVALEQLKNIEGTIRCRVLF
jgi:D-3-phosphoglycerate dehydrogenase